MCVHRENKINSFPINTESAIKNDYLHITESLFSFAFVLNNYCD